MPIVRSPAYGVTNTPRGILKLSVFLEFSLESITFASWISEKSIAFIFLLVSFYKKSSSAAGWPYHGRYYFSLDNPFSQTIKPSREKIQNFALQIDRLKSIPNTRGTSWKKKKKNRPNYVNKTGPSSRNLHRQMIEPKNSLEKKKKKKHATADEKNRSGWIFATKTRRPLRIIGSRKIRRHARVLCFFLLFEISLGSLCSRDAEWDLILLPSWCRRTTFV